MRRNKTVSFMTEMIDAFECELRKIVIFMCLKFKHPHVTLPEWNSPDADRATLREKSEVSMKALLLPLVLVALTACNEHKRIKSSDAAAPSLTKSDTSTNLDDSGNPLPPGIPKGIYNGNNFNLLSENEGLITLKDADGKALFAALSVKGEDSNGVQVKNGTDISCRETLCTLTVDVKEGQINKAMNPGKYPKIDTRVKKPYDSENLHLERSVLGVGNNGTIKLSGKDADTLFKGINLGGVDSTAKNGDALITKKTRDIKCVKTTEKDSDKESVVCEIKFRQRNGEIIQNKVD
jgi:hypothetical protein